MQELIGALTAGAQAEFFDAVSLLVQGRNLAMPLCPNLSPVKAGLFELRLRDSAGPIRILFYVKEGDAIYFLHGFRKKTQQLPARELPLGLKRLREV